MANSVRNGLASRMQKAAKFVSIRAIAQALHLGFPLSVRDLVAIVEPIKLSFRLDSGTCSGFSEITMTNDGRVHYTGNVHDSGALAARYIAITSFDVSGQALVIQHQGHVGGTFSLDTRDSSWDLTSINSFVAENWAAVKASSASARTQFGTGTGAFEIIDGLVTGGGSLFVFSL
jgi:hypothetical protein